MTSIDDMASAVTRLRKPPIHAATLVRSDAAHTFDTFVRTIGAWWPVEPFSGGRDHVRDVTLEPKVGGLVYETWDDGRTVEWGEILAWEPPARFVMSWRGTPAVTEVELTFTTLGPNLTRVSVEHRGWDALSEAQLSEDCALPGGYNGGAYDAGWRRILDAFAVSVAPAEEPAAIEITDEYMLEMLSKSRSYILVLLKDGPNSGASNRDEIIWEHGRRNFALRADGVLAIVCPILDDSPWCGIYIFDAAVDEVARVMDDDPGVRAGVFSYEIHPVGSFPGDRLPGSDRDR
jgi:uncharacterized protein YndB with AHSA1/START domain